MTWGWVPAAVLTAALAASVAGCGRSGLPAASKSPSPSAPSLTRATDTPSPSSTGRPVTPSPPGPRTPVAAPTTTVQPTRSAPTTAAGEGNSGAQLAQTAAAKTAAVRFLTAFARPDVPYAQWWANLKPLLDDQGRMYAEFTDPAQIPVRNITGPAALSRSGEDDLSLTFAVPTNIGTYTVQLTYTAAGTWLVSRYSPPQGVR